MKVRWKKVADKEIKVGETFELEADLEQSTLDEIIRERLERAKKENADQLKDLQKKIDDLTASLAAANTKATEAEGKVAGAETRATTAEATAKLQLAGLEREKKILQQLMDEGVTLPAAYLGTIKVEAGDTDEVVKAKVQKVVEGFKADLKKHGGARLPLGDDGQGGGGGEGTGGWSDSELTALANGQFKTLVNNAGGDNATVLRLMKEKAKAGELEKYRKK